MAAALLATALTLAWNTDAAGPLSRHESTASWTMHLDLCVEPGHGSYGLRVADGWAFLGGWAACPGYQHSVDYGFPLEEDPEGGWRFESPEARLRLDEQARLVRFEEHNPILGLWVLFLP